MGRIYTKYDRANTGYFSSDYLGQALSELKSESSIMSKVNPEKLDRAFDQLGLSDKIFVQDFYKSVDGARV